MFGQKLKSIRKHISATQDEMANILDIPVRTYSSYEREENNPPYNMLVTLCKKHNINLNWFIADIGEMFNAPQFDAVKSELRQEVLQILKDEGIIK